MAYPQELRDRVLRGWERGEAAASIARRLEVSLSWVYRVKERWKRRGEREAQRQGGYRISRIAGWELQIRAWLKKEVDLTLTELCARLREHGVVIRVTALWHQLNKWKLTLKKNRTRQRARARRRAERAPRVARKPVRVGRRQIGIS